MQRFQHYVAQPHKQDTEPHAFSKLSNLGFSTTTSRYMFIGCVTSSPLITHKCIKNTSMTRLDCMCLRTPKDQAHSRNVVGHASNL